MHFKTVFFSIPEEEKNNPGQRVGRSFNSLLSGKGVRKIFLVMKLVTILIMAACLQVSAGGHSQTVSLSESNAPLKKVFTKISQQTGYTFFCDEALISNAVPVTVNLKEVALESALDACLKDQQLTYAIIGNNIVIKEKEKAHELVVNKELEPLSDPVPVPFIDIKGRVVSESGEALAGASVNIKGTKIGVSTDNKGNFSINANLGSKLVISYIGYNSLEVDVKKQDLGTITLQLSDKVSDQVVIVGYGAVQRENLTSSVSSVKASDVVKSTETSLNAALQGRAAGVNVVSSEGGPAPKVSITIRAGSSISASNEPLYVINGFPQLGGSNLNINVNDIESVDILKDGAAAAYGSRGANGVVLITTKSGKNGKFQVSYDAYLTKQVISNEIPVMNSGQYAELQHFLSSSSEYGDTSFFKNWQNYADSPSINWQDRILRDPLGQAHNLTLSGGTEKVKVLTSFGYFHQPGIVVGTQYDRYTLNINTKAQINKFLSNETIVYLAQGIKSGPEVNGSSGPIYSAIKGAPFIGSGFKTLSDFLFQHLGFYGEYGVDPVIELQDPKLKSTSFSGSLNTAFSMNLMEHLKLRLSLGINKDNSQYKAFYPSTTASGHLANGSAYMSSGEDFGWLNENTLNYTNTFKGVHDLDATAGFSIQSSTNEGYSLGARDFVIQSLGMDNLNLGTRYNPPGSSKERSQLMSFFGVVRYSYLNRYLFSAIMRADGSSKFPNNQWGYFPYVSAAWKINEEPFFAKFANKVSQLKLRLSYGQTGNESVPPYSSLVRYTPTPANSDHAGGLTTALGPAKFGVGDLKWETNIQTNIGLDLGLFNDRITFTADAYRKQSKNLLLAAKISTASGYSSVFKNVGDIEVQGLELNLNTQNVRTKKFSWNSNFNISFTKGKVNRLTEDGDYFYIGDNEELFIVKVGDRLGGMYGYVVDGLYNTDEELFNGPDVEDLAVGAGTRKFKDISGPDGKPDGVVNSDDRTIIGNGNPKFFGGFNNDFRLGPIDLSFLFTFSAGNDIMNRYEYLYNLPTGWQGGPAEMYNYHWTNQNPQVNNLFWARWADNEYTNLTSYQIQDGSYLRLKNVMLGYNLPESLIRKMGLTKFRLYVSGQNLLTFTKYNGYDPEVNYYNSVIRPGVDYGSYPKSRIITFGLNVSF